MASVVITRKVAEKVLRTVNAGLVSGLGQRKPGEMCVEAAVCYALGLPHGDDPGCVSQPLRRLKIRLNDFGWSSPQARTDGLRRLALAQLGSTGHLDDKEFVRRVVDITIRKAVPVGLRTAAKANPKFASKLEAAAIRCEQEGSRESCLNAKKVAAAAAAAAAYVAAYAAADAAAAAAAYAAAAATADAAADAAAYAAAAAAANAAAAAPAAAYAAAAADAAAYAAADAAAYATAAAPAAAAAYAYAAADAAADAAAAANAAAAAPAAAAAAAAATRDKFLAEYAEWVVQILIDVKAPGCQWLDLAPLKG